MKTKKNQPETSAEPVSAFPVPFTLESFRKDIVEVFVHYVRTVSRMIDCEQANKSQLAWSITGQPPSELSRDLCDQDYKAVDLGLKYEHIQDTMLAQCMESLYEFAFHGRRDPSAEAMEYESSYMWVTDLVMDALYSHMSEEWDSYGGSVKAEAARCVLVAETANARCILEDGKYFSHCAIGKASEHLSEDSLTIRQMALLSGMEEMSIRSAANPKRANPLKTHTAEKGSTRVDRETAKEWLKLKERYIPVTIYSSSAELNLSKQKFATFADLVSALEARAIVIASRIGEETIKKGLEDLGIKNTPQFHFDRAYIAMKAADFVNETLLKAIADLLELPKDLFVLRCRQTVANEQLALIERQLREVVAAPKAIQTEAE